ncbi:uncharacterized protein LOC122249733 [Penaeus japonicus]|uniref:uncharacterized protein LOC122249733 n=1 Tax=Penaeus japonicus TaxID=27405 RepID=UPI001C70AFDF|nr:uncharacterized protein LOC122249733 [Penaeus japonicus]XP_042866780.1 uncharacterized protein LOC122249733 [Penaeus japonicus]
MRTWAILISLCLACTATASEFTLLSQEERAHIPPVYITEVRKVSRESGEHDVNSDFPHRDHDVKIVVEDHSHIPNVKQWQLTFLLDGEQHTSVLEVEENVGSDQKEFVFQTELKAETTGIFITAKDDAGTTLAYGSSQIKIPYMDSQLAWVGTPYDPSSSYLRVDVGILPVIEIGDHVCSQYQSPCYILKERLPDVISRCLTTMDTVTDTPVELCDDTMVPYQELTEPPTLDINDDFTLFLNMIPPQDEIVEAIEVVAYDPKNPTTVFSPFSSQCEPLEEVEKPGTLRCSQNLRMTEKIDVLEVVVVVMMNQNGSHLQSTLLTYRLVSQEAPVQTSLIVGSIVGVLAGLALIAGIVFLVRKNKNKGRRGEAKTTSAHYTSAPTSDPATA